MEKSNAFDKRKAMLERMLKSDYIPLFDGRPKREDSICGDDLINLEIALKTVTTVDDFVNSF